MKWISIVAGICIGFCSVSANAASGRFVVVSVHLDQVMQPQSTTDALLECVQSALCKAIIDRSAEAFGVPISELTSAIARIPRADKIGEEAFFEYKLPPGYKYCNSKTSTVSIVPRDGSGGSLMRVTSNPDGLSVYTWTPRLKTFDGRSWVEADFDIVGIQEGEAEQSWSERYCRRPGKELMNCRGNGTGDDGRPACGVVAD